MSVHDVSFHVLPMQTRFPFQYGIASMTALPHLFVTVRGECGGVPLSGVSSEGLPPKWFTKDPETTFEDDLPQMLEVITVAASNLTRAATGTFFDHWKELYYRQESWARENGVPPLLANLGVSLMERALLDGFCRAMKVSLAEALRSNVLGLALGEVRDELAGNDPADLLPAAPLSRIVARHTVGLGDPLTTAQVEAPLEDGLPFSLEECIAAYGIDHFKVKLCGVLEKDLARLRTLQEIFQRDAAPDYKLTLDGNEQFPDIATLAAHWQAYRGDEAIRDLLTHVLFVEQPLHRDSALADEVKDGLSTWSDAPPLIIDESEADLTSLPRALDLGYAGTSHKNCKGIVKGIANACLLEHRRRRDPGRQFVLSGEDLANVGPVALLQDLAVMACLGIDHVERNGHHYFRGLSMYPDAVQAAVLAEHSDLYRRHEAGFPTLNITAGSLEIGSVVTAPFGTKTQLATSRLQTLDAWLADPTASPSRSKQ